MRGRNINNNYNYRNNNNNYNQNYHSNYNQNFNQNFINNYNQGSQSNRLNLSRTSSSFNFWSELDFVKRINDHSGNINNLIALNELNYLTSDSNKFCIRKIDDFNNSYNEGLKNTIIKRIIFSSGKIILSLENILETNELNINNINTYEKKVSYEIRIGIVNNGKIEYFSCFTNNKPIDIFESDNRIVTAGNNFIELFQFNNNQLSKLSEIKLSNNSYNNGKNIIICIERINDFLMCGHFSGHISIWKPVNDNPFLNNTSISRIHFGIINKIIYDKNPENMDVIISCSSDKTVKVHSVEETVCLIVKKFKYEVIDIKKLKDLNNYIYYIISLKNGQLKIYDNSLKTKIFSTKDNGISSPNINAARYVINIIYLNSNNNNEENNYVIITEGKKIDIYKWKNWNNNGINNNNNKINFHGNKKHDKKGKKSKNFK
jgi:hypothetical protein